MKVVSVLTTESAGGAEFAAVELLDALIDKGHEAVLLTNRLELQRETGVETRAIDLGPKLSRSTYKRILVSFPSLLRRLRQALAQEAPYDVLLVHFKKEQLLARSLKRPPGSLIVWAEWGPVPFEFRTGAPNKVYRRAAEAADLVLAISAGTRQSVIDAGVPAEKVVVVANAVRTDELRFSQEGRRATRDSLGIPQDAFVVGCVSRFHPKKRNDVVVEAVTRLEDGNVHLVLAGGGETEAELRALAGPLGDRAHFIPTPTADVADVYSAFDVSVFCPSPTEGAPRAVILAMLCERPVLSTGAEGVADLLTEGGAILSPENDPAALAAALRTYLAEATLGPRHGAAGRALVERTHAAPTVADSVIRLFDAAMARRNDR